MKPAIRFHLLPGPPVGPILRHINQYEYFDAV